MIFCILLLIIFAYGFWKLDCNLLLAFYEKFYQNKNSLKNKTCWVIGATTGIGEELAYQLVDLNCRLVLTATNENKLLEVKQKCLKRSKNLKEDDILVLAYDISEFKQHDKAFEEVMLNFGNIDVLICNAGRIALNKIVDDDFEILKKLFDINYFSHVYLTKKVVRHWLEIKAKDKLVVATSSMASYVDIPEFQGYVSTKKALNSFFRDLSMQHQKDKIYVSLILPGPVETDIKSKSLTPNKKIRSGDSRTMAVERCAHLMLVAMANRLHEVWICTQPALLVMYIFEKFGYYSCLIIRTFGLAGMITRKIYES